MMRPQDRPHFSRYPPKTIETVMTAIHHPYLMFLGDAPDQLAAKTAQGIVHWRPEWCVGQLRLDGCKADLKLPDMTIEAAAKAGVRTVIVGVANRGGILPDHWLDMLVKALDLGMDKSEDHTSELQSLLRISYPVFCL